MDQTSFFQPFTLFAFINGQNTVFAPFFEIFDF